MARGAALILAIAIGGAACSTGGTDGAGAAGSGGTGGSSDAGAPTFGTDFTDLNDWTQRNGRGAAATIGIGAHPSAEDGSALALLFPGAPGLGPMDFQGPASAVEVESVATFHYGRYETSVRFASCAATEEIVSGIFTYLNDGTDLNGNGIADNSEIDVELLCGEPYLLWLTIWTDYETTPAERFRKTTRVFDMRTGEFQQTVKGREGEYGVGPGGRFTDIAEMNFPNPDRFYVIGFDWQPSFVRYYARLGGSEIELWKFEDASLVPQRPSKVLLNLWHAPTHWMKGGPANYPAADGTMLVDWVRVWQNP